MASENAMRIQPALGLVMGTLMIAGCTDDPPPTESPASTPFLPPILALADTAAFDLSGPGVHHVILHVDAETRWFPDFATYTGAGPKWHWILPRDTNALWDGACEKLPRGVLYERDSPFGEFGEIYVMTPGNHTLLVAIEIGRAHV